MTKSATFNVEKVKSSMSALEGMFQTFSTTLKDINSYIQTTVNVNENSAVFGNYGSKMLAIWNENASTFGDFHANFTAWSEVVSVIAAAKQNFVVDTAAMYKNDGGNLDGISATREYLKNGSSGKVTEEIREVLDSREKVKTQYSVGKSEYGGAKLVYTDSEGNTVTLYYDKYNGLAVKEVDGKNGKVYYDRNNKKLSSKPSKDKYYSDMKAKQKKEIEKSKTITKEILDEITAKAGEYDNPGGLSGYRLDFINEIKDGAVATYKEYGVLPSLTLAQAILETGWGESRIGNNIFGIKAGSGWTGKTINCKTGEQNPDGSRYTINADFRDYDSVEDSIIDHAKLLTNDRYKPVLAAKNYKEACKQVRACGYATSLDYANNLISLVESYGLDQWDPK